MIEDASQAHGAEYRSRRVGGLADAACFSFYPGKNLGAFGEAGAVVTDRADLAEKIRTLRDHGQSRKYHHTMIGWNGRMDGIQAAVLRIKLQHLARGNELRRSHAAAYTRAFAGVEDVRPPVEMPYAKHVYHIYALRVPMRDELLRALEERGIGCGVHYPVPVHLQEAYAGLGHRRGSFPISELTSDEFISLPMFPELTPEQIETVAHAVKDCLAVGALS